MNRSTMIDYQTARPANDSPAVAMPAADDRLAVAIREALRDRQAAQMAGRMGGGQ